MKKTRAAKNRTSVKSVRRRDGRFLFAVFLALTLPIVNFCFSIDQLVENYSTRAASVFSPHRIFSGAQNYSVFSHSVRAHADASCNSCHARGDNSIAPRFAGHSACINCHLTQFVTPQSPMCAICHSDVQSSSAPIRAFPAGFIESFNMKFDHAAHNRGDGRPANGCVACHKPLRAGVALSIPANLTAHNQCYSCHTPNRSVGGQDIGSCSVCHSPGGYRRTSTNGVAFQANFAHADHGSRQRLACADCHSIKAGMPQTKQVSSPVTAEHFSSSRAMNCMTCHNDKRAFGDRDFANCKRCHTKATFDTIR